jgi:ISXO2-like transposase domain
VVTNFAQVKRAFKKHASPDANLMTDEHKKFRKIDRQLASHGVINPIKYEHVRGNVSTSTIEGVFSIFRRGRGMTGVYQHCGSQHLHRYLAEFDFRYNHRSALAENERCVRWLEGKRLTSR